MVRQWLIAAALVAGCKRHDAPEAPVAQPKPAELSSKAGAPVTRGTLRRAKVETSYAVAVPSGADVSALEKLAREKGPQLAVTRGSLTDALSASQLDLAMRQLEQGDVDGLKASPGVIVLRGSGSDGVKLAREIAGVARDIADVAHGWILDRETIAIYPAAAFHDHVPAEHPDVRKLIVVHSVGGSGEQPFLDTAGLHRYGFPELYVSETSTGHISQITHLINGAAQTLLDSGDVDGRGELTVDFHKLGWDVGIIEKGTGKAVWKLRWAKEPDAGDDEDLVVELVPASGEGTDAQAKLISDCFGFKPDEMAYLKDDDPELVAAVARARADLGKLRSHFATGIPVDERLSIKAKFTGDEGQVEWMWVDIVSFKGDLFEGTLANDPELIPTLRDGQKVKVNLADIGDYVLEKRGSKPAGGYSIELLRKRGLVPADAE